jgi:hypothetical protein
VPIDKLLSGSALSDACTAVLIGARSYAENGSVTVFLFDRIVY